MPHIPKWMADAIENLLPSKFFDTLVVNTTYVNPEILKITFSADLLPIAFQSGWAIVLRTGVNDLRHYTISAFDQETGLFDILFHMHGNGPSSTFVSQLTVGEKLKMAIPTGRKMFVPESDHHFFFGDETSLSFILIMIAEISRKEGTYQGVVELREQNRTVAEQLHLTTKTVLRTADSPGMHAISYLKELASRSDFPLEKYVFYLTGNVSSVQAFRKELKKIGVHSKNIKFQGYWVEGSIGM